MSSWKIFKDEIFFFIQAGTNGRDGPGGGWFDGAGWPPAMTFASTCWIDKRLTPYNNWGRDNNNHLSVTKLYVLLLYRAPNLPANQRQRRLWFLTFYSCKHTKAFIHTTKLFAEWMRNDEDGCLYSIWQYYHFHTIAPLIAVNLFVTTLMAGPTRVVKYSTFFFDGRLSLVHVMDSHRRRCPDRFLTRLDD